MDSELSSPGPRTFQGNMQTPCDINSFVVVEKVIDSSNAHSPHHSIKKSIRLCIDPKDLNEALEREPYYSRTIDEVISMFAGAKVFTIVDMDKGYWQVVLHPDMRKYT